MSEWNCPGLSVEAAIFNEHGQLLLLRRGKDPYKGKYALPGGRMEIGENARQNCARELEEETGIIIDPKDLVLIGEYSDPNRDPRRHNVSLSFVGFVRGQTPKETPEGQDPKFFTDLTGLDFAFDHAQVIADALTWRDKFPTPRLGGGRVS
jgi:8-oxo-dGTP diphosphatase